MSDPIENERALSQRIQNRQEAERLADTADGRNDGLIDRQAAMRALYERARSEFNNGDIFKAFAMQTRYHEIGEDGRATQPRMTNADIDAAMRQEAEALRGHRVVPRVTQPGERSFFDQRADDPNRGARGR